MVLHTNCGYTATVKVAGNVNMRKLKVRDIEINDRQMVGANAQLLTVLRAIAHKSGSDH